MPGGRSNTEGALATLCETIEFAKRMAEETPIEGNPSYAELLEALSCARFSALRLVVELRRSRERPAR